VKHPLGRSIRQHSRPLYLAARYVYRGVYNLRGDLNRILHNGRAVTDIKRFERSWYSQNGEDGILKLIFSQIGVTNKFYVEFGVEDGSECNTRYLRERHGWTGLMRDGGSHPKPVGDVRKEFITAENICSLLEKYKVPNEFDLLSIDIDGNDYWVWKAIQGYSPRVVLIEYNSSIMPDESKTIPYDPEFRWDGTNYFGASILALANLGRAKGYTLIGCDNQGINAVFLRDDQIDKGFVARPIVGLYAEPRYGEVVGGKFIGHHPSPRLSEMVIV
jgi:hypothetical protein